MTPEQKQRVEEENLIIRCRSVFHAYGDDAEYIVGMKDLRQLLAIIDALTAENVGLQGRIAYLEGEVSELKGRIANALL